MNPQPHPAPPQPANERAGDGEAPTHLTAPTPIVDAYMRDYVDGVDSALTAGSSTPMPPALRSAVHYALLGGGKRLRPLLAWHCCVAVGGAAEASLPAGAAVEFIHAFSLVHDDLPGLDNDDLRRGRPTLHKATSEAMAILAGDAMLTMAFQVLVDRVADPVTVKRLVTELAIGTSGMITGQVYDTLGGFDARLTRPEMLALVHRNKTGALIRAACRMGALAGGATEATLQAVTAYGDAIGLMFQIVDDIIDVEQSAEHAGKRTQKDEFAGKLTYPSVLGLEGAKAEVGRVLGRALAALSELGPPARPLADLASYMAVRTK